MKIKCITNINTLTIGKIYDIINYNNDGGYIIINDNGYEFWYPKEWFKPLSEIRNEKIDKLLEDESKMY
jgi:hypothetical protein